MILRRFPVLFVLAFAAGMLGCAGDSTPVAQSGPPTIEIGKATCAACKMTVNDAQYAPAMVTAKGEVKAYDSIECMVYSMEKDKKVPDGATVWLPDYDNEGVLHPASEMTIVRADFESPMGGGFAAFKNKGRASAESDARGGVLGPLTGFLDGSVVGGL